MQAWEVTAPPSGALDRASTCWARAWLSWPAVATGGCKKAPSPKRDLGSGLGLDPRTGMPGTSWGVHRRSHHNVVKTLIHMDLGVSLSPH